jgi:signal transduction histidine kinase
MKPHRVWATESAARRLGFGVVFLVGLLAAILPVATALDGGVTSVDVASLGAMVVEVGLLWGVAIHLRDDRFSGGDVVVAAAWTVALMTVGLALGATLVFSQMAAGGELVEPLLLVDHLALVGGVTGALVGSYDAQSRVRERSLTQERSRLADRSARLAFMNQLLRHDIRNDANVIQGYASLLAERTDNEYSELDRILRKADHVTELTTVAGDLASSLDAQYEETPLDPVLVDSVESVRASFPEAIIEYDRSAEGVTVAGTPLLSSVFTNLVRNAVQHNDSEQPRVCITVEDGPANAVVTVRDNGPGIDPSVSETLFAPGERHSTSAGLGLGLHLVETIVTDVHGDVEVGANEPRGAVFRVSLPLARAVRDQSGGDQDVPLPARQPRPSTQPLD